MSPHEANPVEKDTLSLAERLSTEFAVTKNGFVPVEAPITRLSSPYYEPWEMLGQNISTFLRGDTLRQKVDDAPLLSVDHLTTEAEWRRAYLILTFLTHAYVWGGDTPSERLPPQITVPLLRVSEHLDLPPVATYAATALWNFTSSSAASCFEDLDALQSLITFTGTPDESWFFMVSVAMECEGGAVIPATLAAMESIPAGTRESYAAVTDALEALMACIRRVGAVLDRMHERCQPEVFYHAIRPFLAGSKNMAGAGLPRGVFYDEGDGKGQWRRLRGGSNGQSSLIQFFDIALGVEHAASESQNSRQGVVTTATTTNGKEEQGEEKEVPFHEEVRGYMPGPHRRFLERVRALPSIRRFALQETGAVDPALQREQDLLRDTFQRATRVLAEFRNKHLQIVTRYIVVPSRKEQQQQQKRAADQERLAGVAWRQPPQNPVAVPKKGATAAAAVASGGGGDEAKASSSAVGGRRRLSEETQLTGTGGTALMPFLKQVRDETVRAGRPDGVVVV